MKYPISLKLSPTYLSTISQRKCTNQVMCVRAAVSSIGFHQTLYSVSQTRWLSKVALWPSVFSSWIPQRGARLGHSVCNGKALVNAWSWVHWPLQIRLPQICLAPVQTALHALSSSLCENSYVIVPLGGFPQPNVIREFQVDLPHAELNPLLGLGSMQLCLLANAWVPKLILW